MAGDQVERQVCASVVSGEKDWRCRYKRMFGRVRLISFLSAAVGLAVGGGVGYVLDLVLDKQRFWTIIGLVVGLAVTGLLSAALTRRQLKKGRLKI